jgi:SAM-dependent methyltransferase
MNQMASETDSNRVCLEEGRLVYYRRNMGRSFWDEHWNRYDTEQFYRPYLKGYIGRGRLAQIFQDHLPRTGRIVEAGCGKAQHVISLRARGYDCLGIDNARETIARVHRLFPELPIVYGDVCCLPYKNRSLSAYISLGVVEHFIEGPDAALREAARVLQDRGLLIISVPQLFPWRLREVSSLPLSDEFSFYQYAFPHEEFAALLGKNNFTIEQQCGYNCDFGLQLRWPGFSRLVTALPRTAVAVRLMLDYTPLYKYLARMLLFVARKK